MIPFRRAAGHRPRPGQAEHRVGGQDAGVGETAAQGPRKRRGQHHGGRRTARLDPAQHGLRLQRHPRGAQAIVAADSQDQARDGGMQMEMLVGVDMVQRQAGGTRRLRTAPRSRLQAGARTRGGKTSPPRPAPCRCGNCRRHRPGRGPMRPAAAARPPPAPDAGRRAGWAWPCARATASAAAGAATIRLAAVRMPWRWACSTASLTCAAAPKSSAVTMRRFTNA